ncbi:TetR/AcrR family transcriptional regulator [Singulisphaera sp. PoT]|uniref:TetR/AcrR family transcriptional regulator n=1 Tax=Singulisphaera sp. PoT TaxID=3411797 RepID=UPI003BF4CFAF
MRPLPQQRPAVEKDSETTRAAILKAATLVFAARGFSGASIRDIADAARINKPVIYHYFKSKQGLFESVKDGLVAASALREAEVDADERQPEDLRGEVERLFAFFRREAVLLRVDAWSRLEQGCGVGPGDVGVLRALRDRLERAKGRRIIRQDVDPGSLAIMLAGLVSYWLGGLGFSGGFDEDRMDDPRRLQQAMALVEYALAPAPEALSVGLGS